MTCEVLDPCSTSDLLTDDPQFPVVVRKPCQFVVDMRNNGAMRHHVMEVKEKEVCFYPTLLSLYSLTLTANTIAALPPEGSGRFHASTDEL
jgi:hypothetical protein